jgi:hypothetical protein
MQCSCHTLPVAIAQIAETTAVELDPLDSHVLDSIVGVGYLTIDLLAANLLND